MKLFKLIKKSRRIAYIMAMGLMTMTALAATTVSTMAWFSHMNTSLTGVVNSGSLDLTIGDTYGYKSVRQADANGELVIDGTSVTKQKANSTESDTNVGDDTVDVDFDVPTDGVGYYMVVQDSEGNFKYSNPGTKKLTTFSASSRAYCEYTFTQTPTALQFRIYDFVSENNQTRTKNETVAITAVSDSNILALSNGNVTVTLGNSALGTYKLWFDHASTKVGIELVRLSTIAETGRKTNKSQPKKEFESGLYLRYSANSWQTLANYALIENASDKGKILDVALSAGEAFKIANSNWSSQYGYPALKDWGDAEDSFGRAIQNNIMWSIETNEWGSINSSYRAEYVSASTKFKEYTSDSMDVDIYVQVNDSWFVGDNASVKLLCYNPNGSGDVAVAGIRIAGSAGSTGQIWKFNTTLTNLKKGFRFDRYNENTEDGTISGNTHWNDGPEVFNWNESRDIKAEIGNDNIFVKSTSHYDLYLNGDGELGINTSKYTVNFSVSPSGYGGVSSSSVPNVPYGTSFSASGTTFSVNGSTITASPAAQTDQYSYEFSSWSRTTGTITGNTTITANFSRIPKLITINLNSNGGVDASSTTIGVTVDSTMTTLTAAHIPTNGNSIFGGFWSKDDSGNFKKLYYFRDGTSTTICDLSDGATLYARWFDESNLFKGGETYYLLPNSTWKANNPVFYLYLCNGPDATTQVLVENVPQTEMYKATLPAGDFYWQNMIYLRLNATEGDSSIPADESTDNNGWWVNNHLVRNQTGDLSKSQFVTSNCCKITTSSNANQIMILDTHYKLVFFSPFTEGERIYLKPNAGWKVNKAAFALYVFGGSNAATKWFPMTKYPYSNGSDNEYWYVDIEGDDDNLAGENWIGGLFVRYNGGETLGWGNGSVYNQTPDQYRPESNKTCYVIDSFDNGQTAGRWVALTNRTAGKYYLIGTSTTAGSKLIGLGWCLDKTESHPLEAFEQDATTPEGNNACWKDIVLKSSDIFKIVYVDDLIPIWIGYEAISNAGCASIQGFVTGTSTGSDITVSRDCVVNIYVNQSRKIWVAIKSFVASATGAGYKGASDAADSSGNKTAFDVSITMDLSNVNASSVAPVTSNADAPANSYFVLHHYSTVNTKNGANIVGGGSLASGAPTAIFAIYWRKTTNVTIYGSANSTNVGVVVSSTAYDQGTSDLATTYAMDPNFAHVDSSGLKNGILSAYSQSNTNTDLYLDLACSSAFDGTLNSSTLDLYVYLQQRTPHTYYLDTAHAGSAAWTGIYITNTNGDQASAWIHVDQESSTHVAPQLFKLTMPEGWEFRVTNGESWDNKSGNNWTGNITIPTGSGNTLLYVGPSANSNCAATWANEVAALELGTASIIVENADGSAAEGSPYTMNLGNLITVSGSIRAGNNYFTYEPGINLAAGQKLTIALSFQQGTNSPLKDAVADSSNTMGYGFLDSDSKASFDEGTSGEVVVRTSGRYTFYVTAAAKIAIASVPSLGNGTFIMPYTNSTKGYDGAIKMTTRSGNGKVAYYHGFYVSNTTEKYYVRSYINTVDKLFTTAKIDTSALKNAEATVADNVITFKQGKYNLESDGNTLFITAFAVDDFFNLDPLKSGLSIQNNFTSLVLEVEVTLLNNHPATITLYTNGLPTTLGIELMASATPLETPYQTMRNSYLGSLKTGSAALTLTSNALPANQNPSTKYYVYIIIDYVVSSGTALASNPGSTMSFKLTSQQA